MNMREMKDSGILGVGKVPISWEQTRLGYECYIRARLGWRGLKADEYVDEGYAFISAFNIQDGKLVWEPLNYITQERYDESPEIKLNIGDVLLVKDGAGVGKSARVDSLPCGGTAPNSSIGVITPYNSMSYRYVCYYIQSPVFSNFVGLLYNGMGVPHLTQEILKTIRILMPPLDEQQSICDYLDEKCAEFDTIKSDIQSQIEALEEYKRSVITEAVTKGLDPDVEMRDSGFEWLGFIPSTWQTRKGKYIFVQRNERGNSIELQLLSPTQKYGVKTLPEYDVFISHANKDKEGLIDELYESLNRLGIKIFYDKESLIWGDEWKKQILNGVSKAEFAIIVISKNFFDREWTEKELTQFLNRQNKNGQKLILPILHNISMKHKSIHENESHSCKCQPMLEMLWQCNSR